LLAAAPQIFLPIGELWIYRAEGNQESRAMLFAIGCEPCIDASDVPVKQTVETPDPRLADSMAPHARHKIRRVVACQPTERPS
jgi:hypothetical protein